MMEMYSTFLFDFAEKVMFPRVVRQPGQLYFATGLTFDPFGRHESNKGVTFFFGLQYTTAQ